MFQNSKIPAYMPWAGRCVFCLKNRQCQFCLAEVMHSQGLMNERKNTPKSFVLEKNWNFGISTGYPHFDTRNLLISLGF
jgi:hypothetical protein